MAYAEANGIAVKNTPRASSNSVAELALAHMLSCARFVSIAGHTMREGKWEKKAYGKGVELGGKTLGVIGYGRIGQALGRMAQGLGMNVVAYDIFHVEGIECETCTMLRWTSCWRSPTLFRCTRPPSTASPHQPREHREDEGRRYLCQHVPRQQCRRGSSAGRLNSGKIRGAGLDVYAEEPAKNEALLNHPNVSCTPHIGAATKEAQKRIGMEIVSIIDNL